MGTPFNLPAELTIYNVAQTRDAMQAWVAQIDPNEHEPLQIVASAVEDIDGSGLQLLGSLLQTLGRMGQSWQIAQPTQALLNAAQTLGAQSWLNATPSGGTA
jgi:anti-anti-sigma regulatory factor